MTPDVDATVVAGSDATTATASTASAAAAAAAGGEGGPTEGEDASQWMKEVEDEHCGVEVDVEDYSAFEAQGRPEATLSEAVAAQSEYKLLSRAIHVHRIVIKATTVRMCVCVCACVRGCVCVCVCAHFSLC
eukprot:GHVU01144180.1.p1 GENE.GHVU01144180.1~~GHVU01144180.1.p1  ORF type:complete len:139 (+),score=40.25 GHVU01144180.1:23-418(+)